MKISQFTRPLSTLLLGLTLSLTPSLAPTALSAAPLTHEEMKEDLEQLFTLYEKNYGLFKWKAEHLGLDFNELTTRYRAQMESVQTEREFFQLISTYITEFKDPHLSFSPTEERVAFLGFGVRHVENKAIIDRINRNSVPQSIFPYELGTELISIDGATVEKMVAAGRRLEASGNEKSTVAMLYRLMTVRLPHWGPFPSGNATIVVKPAGSDQEVTTIIPWIIRGRALPGMDQYAGGDVPSELTKETRFRSPLYDLLETTGLNPQRGDPAEFEGAKIVNKKDFLAAILDTPAGPVGYVQIPSFSPSQGVEKALKQYKKVFKEMWVTNGMVLDLRDNPGGSLFYGYAMASMLTDKPLVTPTFGLRPTRKNIVDYRSWAQSASSAAEQAALKNVVTALESAFESGETMTDFMPLDGLAVVNPDPDVQYTKPIVILTTELNASMGDIWPAMMQDNGRALLFGANTQGAGGAVVPAGPLTNSEARLTMTVNMVMRQNGQPIENLGTAPDVPFELSIADIRTGNQRYRSAYMGIMIKLIQMQQIEQAQKNIEELEAAMGNQAPE